MYIFKEKLLYFGGDSNSFKKVIYKVGIIQCFFRYSWIEFRMCHDVEKLGQYGTMCYIV